MLSENHRGFVSLVVLALFMAIVFCTSAFAGKGGGHPNNGEAALLNQEFLQQSQNRN